MSHRRAGWWLPGALVFAANAAAAPGPAGIDDIALDVDGAEVTFAQSMVTWPNAVAPGTVSVEGGPALDCHWADDATLTCKAPKDQKLHRATRYRVRVAPGLQTQAGDSLKAFTDDAETTRPSASLSITGWEQGVPLLRVDTALETSPGQLSAALEFSWQGRTLRHPDVVRLKPANQWDTAPHFSVALPALDGAEGDLVLVLKPGLRSSEGPLPSTKGATLRVRMNEAPRLREVECDGPQKRRRAAVAEGGPVAIRCVPGTVLLRFSQAPTALDDWKARLPAGVRFANAYDEGWQPWRVDARAVQVRPGSVVQLSMDADNATFALPDVAALRVADGAGAMRPGSVVVATLDRRPSLASPGGARQVLATPVDGAAPLATLVGAALRFDVQGIGATTAKAQEPADSERNIPRAVESAATRRVLAEGGWARWTGVGKPLENEPLVEFAAPAFDVFAVSGSRDVLVWANAWDRDAPVAGAALELLVQDDAASAPRVVATGRTSADGTALVRLPDDWSALATSHPPWFLRAKADAMRAVLPMTGYSWRDPLGAAFASRIWGVAERPLYRAGDTVKYRLWLREEHGGRLHALRRPQPVELRLVSSQTDIAILAWTATPDARGNLAGELRLPVHLADDTYCISTRNDSESGSCFFVGTFRAQDLWADIAADRKFARPGDAIAIDASAGYYSGGPAAGVPIALESTLVPLPVAQAYPEFAQFQFGEVVDDDNGAGLVWPAAETGPQPADAQGHRRGTWPARFDRPRPEAGDVPSPPKLGRLRVVAAARLSEREGTTSQAAVVTIVGAERFVGLRSHDWWVAGDAPMPLEAIVLTAEGKPVPGAAIDVEVHAPFAPGEARAPDAPPLARCRLVSQEKAPCAFKRKVSGQYTFRASSPGSEPVEVSRYLWAREDAKTTRDERTTTLEVSRPAVRAGASFEVVLAQPHASARVLLVARNGDDVLWRVAQVRDARVTLAMPTRAGWRGEVSLTAYVRAPEPTPVRDGQREPARMFQAEARFDLPEPPEAKAPVEVTFTAAAPRPGATARLRLHNASGVPRDVVVAVVDDAVRALAGSWLDYTDPNGRLWLGDLRGGFNPALHSFAGWRSPNPVALNLPWPKAPDAATGRTGDPFLPPPPEEPAVVFDDPSPVDIAADAAAAPAFASDDSAGFDRVVVTGSRMRRVDVETASPVTSIDRSQITRNTEGAGKAPNVRMRDAMVALAQAHVRGDFRDAALWLPDLRLAPGESREFDVVLPDNLTRWRALAWSSDADDGFALAEAALESGLPLEVRVQAPVRVFPGDRARVGEHVRRADAEGAPIAATLTASGAGLDAMQEAAPRIEPGGQGSFGLDIAPEATGSVRVVASARTPVAGESDAIGTVVEVASPRIPVRLVQAGWLTADALALPMPALPAGATDATLHVGVQRGGAALTGHWTRAMRDYPHRCWEQVLSRAVAAALALERGDPAWPDAKDVVAEALDNAGAFQGPEGDFRYFATRSAFHGDAYDVDDDGEIGLTAYTVRAFGVLRALGHPVAASIDARARAFLDGTVNERVGDIEDALESEEDAESIDDDDALDAGELRRISDETALAIGALAEQGGAATLDADSLDAAWATWDRQSRPARLATLRALRAARRPEAGAALAKLLDAAPLRGRARRFADDDAGLRWMGSALRDQCELVGLLGEPEASASDREARDALLLGIADLYAGGVEAFDTQAGVHCLLAARMATERSSAATVQATVARQSHAIELAADASEAQWTAPAPDGGTLGLALDAAPGDLVSFEAEVAYVEDARQARASAVGLRIGRRFEVFRDSAWQAIDGATLREGDWLRITLEIDNGKARHFVAITDAVAGGLQPTDLKLQGVAGLRLEALSQLGSPWFGTRRLDPRAPKFYADYLPPGHHEVHYFARVGNAGDYLAPPAQVELMYGNASRARTDAARLKFEAGQGAR